MQSGMITYHVVRNVEDATHWLAYEDYCAGVSCVTPNRFYSVSYDQVEQEYYIIDNDGCRTFIDLCHRGDYVVVDVLSLRPALVA